MKRTFASIVLCILIACAAMCARTADAVTRSWTNNTGEWSDGLNWSPEGVPAVTDDVVIANGSIASQVWVTVTGTQTAGRLDEAGQCLGLQT